MTLLSDDVSFFGTIVPTVYIKRVILEDAGANISNNKNDRINPHVNPQVSSLQDNLTFSAQQGMPNTVGGGIHTIGEYTPEFFKTTVDFLIKENLGNTFNEIATTWSDKKTLQDFTNIQILLVNNSLYSKMLQADPSLIRAPSSEKVLASVLQLAKYDLLSEQEISMAIGMGFSQSSFDKPFKANRFGLQTNIAESTMFSNFNSMADNIVAGEEINLGSAMNGEGINYGNHPQLTQYAEIDEDGKKVVNYQFTKVYDGLSIENSGRYLSLIVIPYLDYESLESNFDLDLGFLSQTQNASKVVGKIKTQNILEAGQIASTSVIYYLEEDMSVWTGHVHKNEDGVFMTGQTDNRNTRKVIQKTVNNSTVQDFRVIDRIERLKFDLSFLQHNFSSLSETYKHIKGDTDVLKQPAYFSKNYMSRGVDGSAKFLFGINLYELVREQTRFGSVLPQTVNSTQMEKARNFYRILNIKVKRRRVDVVPQSNRLGTFNAQEIPFKTGYLGESHIDSEEIVKEVASGKEVLSPLGGLQIETYPPNASSNNTFQAINFSLPDSVGNLNTKGFQFFTGKDVSVSGITDGHYQYGVELQILDKSIDYITSRATQLIMMYRQMMGYYTYCKIPGKTYNVNTGRFRPVLKKYYDELGAAPWYGPIDTLVDVVKEFSNPNDTTLFNPVIFGAKLLMLCSPGTGSPRGVESVLKLILNAATKLAELAGTELNFATISQAASLIKPDGTVDPDFNKPINNEIFAKSPDKRIIKVDYFFDDSFDTEVPKRFGYDYLSPTGNSFLNSFGGNGLATVSGQDYNNRVTLETQKYFEKMPTDEEMTMVDLSTSTLFTTGDTILQSLFSYLTPSCVTLGNGKANTPIGGGPNNPNANMSMVKYSLIPSSQLLGGQDYLFNKQDFTYIAAKITNFNTNAVIPAYDTTIKGDKSLLSKKQDTIKFYSHQILANKNCTAVSNNDPSTLKGVGSSLELVDGVFMTEYLATSIDETDKLIDNDIKLDKQIDDPLSISYKGGTENSLFLTFIYGFSAQNYGIASTKAPASLKPDSKEVTFDFNFFNLQAYYGESEKPKIVQTMHLENSISNNISQAPPPQPGEFQTVDPIIQNKLKSLPNQIKSILLQTKTGLVKHNWGKNDGKNSNNPYYKASIAFNYRNIKRVEYLAGFHYGQPPPSHNAQSSRPLIGRPVWKRLSAQAYANNIANTLFCRLVTYEKKNYGIVPMESLNMPVFDEFFLLQPATYQNAGITVASTFASDLEKIQGMKQAGEAGLESFMFDTEPSEYHDDSIFARPLERSDLDRIASLRAGFGQNKKGTRLYP